MVKRLIKIGIIVAAMLLAQVVQVQAAPVNVFPATCQVSWNAVTVNSDGTTLSSTTPITGYRIWVNGVSGGETSMGTPTATVGASVLNWVCDSAHNAVGSTWFVVVTAQDVNGESTRGLCTGTATPPGCALEVSYTVLTPPLPGSPSNVRVGP